MAGQTQLGYTFDVADRLTQIAQGAVTVGFGYDNANRRTTLTLPNGIVVEYGYDNANQLTGLTYKNGGTTLGALTYAYDNAGRRTQVAGSYARTNLPTAVASATYNANNQLNNWGGATLTYDNNGNLLTNGTNTHTWNARDQLASISGGVAASFGYDAFNRRRTKTIAAVTTDFLYDGLNFVQEKNGATIKANLLTGLAIDEVFRRTQGAVTSDVLPDALGSSVAISDSTKAITTQYTYAPYGTTTQTGTANDNSQKFTGREEDGTTGLYYYRARYYSPTYSRFVSEDPIDFAGGPNLYAYVGGNPVSFRDPMGLVKWTGIVESAGIGPSNRSKYTLVSECIGGYQTEVIVDAVSYSAGGGASWTTSGATFEDHFDYVNPYVFEGPYFNVSAGAVAKWGTGFDLTTMGGATSPGGWSAQQGVGIWAGVSYGDASVASHRTLQCTCPVR